jgi:hypothetical protein
MTKGYANHSVSVTDAVMAASSSIEYFNPWPIQVLRGYTENMVDGNIIAQESSLYSSILAYEMLGKLDIRTVSIGCGV